MIKVANKRGRKISPGDVYVGRPSVLGNKWSHKDGTLAEFKVDTVEEAIKNYQTWLLQKIFVEKDQGIIEAMVLIPDDATLVCWCHPRPCHANIIKEVLEKYRGRMVGYLKRDPWRSDE